MLIPATHFGKLYICVKDELTCKRLNKPCSPARFIPKALRGTAPDTYLPDTSLTAIQRMAKRPAFRHQMEWLDKKGLDVMLVGISHFDSHGKKLEPAQVLVMLSANTNAALWLRIKTDLKNKAPQVNRQLQSRGIKRREGFLAKLFPNIPEPCWKDSHRVWSSFPLTTTGGAAILNDLLNKAQQVYDASYKTAKGKIRMLNEA